MARLTIDQLYALSIPEIQRIFLETMQGAVDSAMIDEMVKAIEAGDVERLYQVSGFTPATLVPIIERIEQTYRDAAVIESGGWPRRILTPSGPVSFVFNMRNQAVEQDLRSYSSEWITRISEEVRENIRTELQAGMARGDNPRTTALNIAGRVNSATRNREGGVIGLASNQVKWANSTRRYLEQLDDRYFTMGLRDKRFDATVRKAIESGKPLPADVVSKLTTAYKSNALRYRGETIARTETIQAINRGERAAHLQAFDEGTLSRSQVTKEWDDTGDRRTRPSHRVLGQTYGRGKGIDFDAPFVSPSGSQMLYPGDSSMNADASEIISCRCKARYRVQWLKGFRRSDG